MLESARRRAEDVLLDQRLFVLDADAFGRFATMLDHPPAAPAALRALLAAKPPWER